MFTTLLLYLALGALASFLGTIPMGPINMTIVYTAIRSTMHRTLIVVWGAALVEIGQAAVALLFGRIVVDYLESSNTIQLTSIVVLAAVGIYFWLKATRPAPERKDRRFPPFLKGVIVGVLNPQALPFWFFVITLLQSAGLLDPVALLRLPLLPAFLFGVFIGKFACLSAYAWVSEYISRRTARVSFWINRILGTVFLVLAGIQLIKWW